MPGAMPVGGGVDGPQYADFQDITDQKQMAGAAMSQRQRLNIVEDTLTMDIATFAGQIKLEGSKAESPVIAPYIKIRTSGPLDLATRSLAQIREEFLRLLEQLPAKLRAQLLKDMQLPKEQRDPNLKGLERALIRQAEANLWARGILKRRSDEEDEDADEEDKGVFALEEEQSPFKAGDLIPPAQLVQLALLEPELMDRKEMDQQIDANAWHAVSAQIRVLQAQMDGMASDDIRRAVVRDAIKTAADILQEARAFLDLRYVAGYEKATENAKAFVGSSPTSIDRDKEAFMQALGGEENSGLRSLIATTLHVTQLAASLMCSRSPSAAYALQGCAMYHTRLLRQASWVGEELIELWKHVEKAFEALGLGDATAQLLALVTLIHQVVAWLGIAAKELVPLQLYKPHQNIGIAEQGSEETETNIDLKGQAQSVSVQAGAHTLLAIHALREVAPTLVSYIEDDDNDTLQSVAFVAQLFAVVGNRMMGTVLFEKTGSGDTTFAEAITTANDQAAQALVAYADELQEGAPLVKASKELKLGQLSYESKTFSRQLADRQEQLEKYGISSTTFLQGGQQLIDIIGELARELEGSAKELGQVTPNVNIVIG